MEPTINLTLSLSVVNAALNALEQQSRANDTAIASIKNQAIGQLRPPAAPGIPADVAGPDTASLIPLPDLT